MATAQASQSKSSKSQKASRERTSERASDAEELSGERDEHYNLVSVLYHGLQGADQAVIYAEDAGDADDEELAEFFRKVGQKHGEIAQMAKQLLLQRLGQSGGGRSRSGRAAASSEDEEDEDVEEDDED